MRNTLALTLIIVAATVALLATGCGGGKKGSTAAGGGLSYPETSSAAAPAPTTGPAASTPARAGVQVTSKRSKYGTILAAGAKKLTVYRFGADAKDSSRCHGVCALVWRPVRTTGAPTPGGTAIPGDLGTITRPDGTKQVTYYHQPLYYYAKDRDSGDAYGHGVKGFGSRWYALRPGAVSVPPLPGSTRPTPLGAPAGGASPGRASSSPASTLSLGVNVEGYLRYSEASLTARAGKVTIRLENTSPVSHNVTIASASGAVVGATPTFQRGSKTLTLDLRPGAYRFYCSVPGHRARGMEGTLTVVR